MRIFLIILLSLALSSQIFAQRGININNIRDQYKGYNAVITKHEINYVFDLVSDTVQVLQHNSKEMMILSDHSLGLTNDYIYFNIFSSIENVDAFTMVPRSGGKGYDKLRVSNFKESHDRENNIFYNDTKTLQFAYPSITNGAFTSLNYTVVYHNPWFIRMGFPQSFVPVLRSKITVKAHKDISTGHLIYNDQEIKFHYKEYSKGKYNYYEWEILDIPPFRHIGNRHYSNRHHTPHIAVFLKEAHTPSGSKKYYDSVDELYSFYRKLLLQTNNDSCDNLQLLVDDLTQGLTDLEKAKAIYYWVQKNIRYIAYSDGYNGFIPAPPAEVFAKRFGDCKGMSALIHKMMEKAGLTAYMAWVGTRTIPYTYNECPLPAVDNHMVVAYIHEDETYILDGTVNFLDFGMYPFHLHGKEVLISIDDNEYRIYRVPESRPQTSMVYDSVAVSISGRTLAGSGKRVHTGFNKKELAFAMDGVSENEYRKKFSYLFEKGNNSFLVRDYRVHNIFQHVKPAEIDYDFTINDYVLMAGDDIYVNMNLDRSYHNMKIDTVGRYGPLINDFACTEKYITKLKIPDGYELISLPENELIVFDQYRVSFTYSRHQDHVILEKEMIFDFLIINDGKFAQWNAFIDRLSRNYRQSVVLSKTNTK
jgi:hypothetical protein